MQVQQAIQNPLGLTIFGSSLLRAQPDLASIQLKVDRLEQNPGQAFQSAQLGARSVRQALRQLNVPDSCVEFSEVTLETSYDHRNDRLIGYEAEVSIRVLLEEIELVETLLTTVVEAGAHRIDGVKYQTKRLKQLREQARQGAIVSAQRKAEVYARAAGVRVGPPIHIEDVNPESMLRRGYHAPDIDVTALDETGEPGVLRPGSIIVTAAVMVAFALLPERPTGDRVESSQESDAPDLAVNR